MKALNMKALYIYAGVYPIKTHCMISVQKKQQMVLVLLVKLKSGKM